MNINNSDVNYVEQYFTHTIHSLIQYFWEKMYV